eukprot:290459-Hanusia_phi.AAC.3
MKFLYRGRLHLLDGTVDKDVLSDKISDVLEDIPPSPGPTRLKVVIFGPPASGKTVQSMALAEKLNLVHICSGELLRFHIDNDTDVGMQAKRSLEAGVLLSDDVIIPLIKERMSHLDVRERGWILDGFPRTVGQIQALKELELEPDFFFLLQVPDAVVLERALGKRIDSETGKIYHTSFSPPPPQLVPRLRARPTDSREGALRRLQTYREVEATVVSYFSCVGRRVDGLRPQQDVSREIEAVLLRRIPLDMSGRPPRRAMPSAEEANAYIKSKLQPMLVKGLSELARVKPAEPLRYLATWMLENNPNRPMAGEQGRQEAVVKSNTEEEKNFAS